MEVSEYLLKIKTNLGLIFFNLLSFLVLSILLYFFLPENYTAEGTLYAYPISSGNQKSEVSNEMNYARNLIALSNTPEFKLRLQEKSLSEVTFIPLVGVVGGLKLREISPNILALSVSGRSLDEVRNKYFLYYESLVDFGNLLKKGNAKFELERLVENPVINRTEKNIFIFLSIGLIIGLFSSFLLIYLKK